MIGLYVVGRGRGGAPQDTDTVDNLLPQTINQLLGTIFLCIFTLATMAFITPWLTVVIGVVSTSRQVA